MEMTREDKERLTKQHDAFVKQYNLFLEEILQHWDKEKTLDEALLQAELRIYSIAIRQNMESLAAVMDHLGWWHRTYNSNPAITKEAANRPILLS